MDKAILRTGNVPVFEMLAGALILAVGMGFGRFSFTGLYPMMVREGAITVSGGSLAASANYAGYLVGALVVGRLDHRRAAALCKFAMLGTIICLGALSLHLPAGPIVAIRFIAGAMSAVTMVAISVWLFHIIGYHHGAPVLYSGVGVGIVASAEIIAAGNSIGISSFALWLVLAVACAVLCALAWSKVHHSPSSSIPDGQELSDPAIVPAPTLGPWLLVLIYGLAGFGYIVTATYLPLLVKNALQHTNPVHVWAAFGLAATPSCFFWHWLHHKLNSRTTMAINLIVQAVGVVLPVFEPSALVFLASAILVGGTFVGTVTIAMPAAKRVADKIRFNIMATMTAAYGVGQIVGPLVSNALFSHTHSFNQPLIAAGAALVVAALACFG
jgi:MFS family permease